MLVSERHSFSTKGSKLDYADAAVLVGKAQDGDRAAMQELLDEVQFSLRSVWKKFVDHPDEGMNPDVVSFLDPADAESIATLAFMDEVMKCKVSEAHKILGPEVLRTVSHALVQARTGGGLSVRHAYRALEASNSMRQDVGAFDDEGLPEIAGLTTDEALELTDGMISKSTLLGYMAASAPVSYDALMHDAYDDADPYGDDLGSAVERDDFLESDPDFLGQRYTADSLEPVREPTNGSGSLSVRLSNAVRQLPPQRQRVALLTAEGWGPTSIAREMGLSEETVKVHKKAAMKQLRELLEGGE